MLPSETGYLRVDCKNEGTMDYADGAALGEPD